MASPTSDEGAKSPTSLQQLIAESDHTAGQRIGEFSQLATAVQKERYERGVADTDRTTRSAALWTLMQIDTSIREALEMSRLRQKELGE